MSGRYTIPLVINEKSSVLDGRRVDITFDINIDPIHLQQMIKRAYGNRSKKATYGPIQIVIEKKK